MNKWDDRFLQFAKLVASWSKDGSTKVGAAIVDPQHRVVSLGFNGPPAGVDDSLAELNRDVKLMITRHAEANALQFSHRDVAGCTLYVWPMPPCAQCAAAIIQAGIRRVVTVEPTPAQYDRWGRDWAVAEEMYSQVGLDLVYLNADSNTLA